jgi:hypothetical protein
MSTNRLHGAGGILSYCTPAGMNGAQGGINAASSTFIAASVESIAVEVE